MLQTQYKIVHVCTGTYMHTVCAMGVVRDFSTVHVCACTYMHAAQDQAYIYGYIYAFGGSLLAIS